MADASYLQTSFLGGEWSPLVQGRQDDPRYRTGMNVSRNTMPIEEGSATRRPGTRLIGPTRKGAKGVLRAFDFQQSHPYNLELTAGHLRFLAGAGIVVESFGTQTVTSINTANPVQLGTPAAHGWATGDEVIVQIATGQLNSSIAALLGRQLEIVVVSSTTFTVRDAVTGLNINGAGMAIGSSDLTVTRIVDFVTPYAESELQAINTVQDQTDLLLLHGSHTPQAVLSTSPEAGSSFAVFSVGAATFKDGPYLDPPKDGTTITPSATSGSVTLTLAGGTTRFASTDVGRLVRLFSEPAAWAIGTAYVVGDQVKFNNAYYQALKNNTGNEPDQDVVNWGVATNAAIWNSALITAFTSATAVTATLSVVTNPDGTTGPILPRTTACTTWRLGLFSDTTGYPTNGTYHEGRLWLAGVIGNRLDGSNSNDFFNFAPTAADGTVADNNACDYVFNAKDVNQIFWMEPDGQGIICGTQAGEWLVQASATNDNLTPTSVQAHRRTNYGCANVPAKRAGITIAFVQRYTKKLLEYITTDYRGLSAHNLSLTGKHLTQKGLVEIAYQAEKVPTLWARTTDGQLLSCTYKRESPYASDPPVFAGWARHDLGGGLTVESIQAGPNYDGTLDALTIITSDGTHRWVQLVSDLFDVDWTIGDALFVDFAETPSMWEVITGPPKLLRLYSLHYLAGKSVDVFVGGIDAGTLTVAADGHLDITLDAAGSILTSTWLASLNSTTNFHGLGIAITAVAAGIGNNPTVTGIANFDSSAFATFSNAKAAIDWDGGRFFITDTASGAIQSNSLTSLAVLSASVITSPVAFGLGITYGEDGFLYCAKAATNCATISRLDPTTFATLASFGAASSSFTTTGVRWAAPDDMDFVGTSGHNFLVSCSQNAATKELTVLDLGQPNFLSTIKWSGFSLTMDEARGRVTRGLPVHGIGQAIVLAFAGNAISPNNITFGLYRVSCISTGIATGYKLATLNSSTLFPGWTHHTECRGICLDETDGNVIAQVTSVVLAAYNGASSYSIGDMVSNGGHDYISLQNTNVGHTPSGTDAFWQDCGVSNASAQGLVKINSHTGAVMWSIAAVLIPGVNGGSFNSTRIRNGKLVFKDAGISQVMHQINTLTGVDTPVNIVNTQYTYEYYNDRTGELVGLTQYSNGGGSPTPIGSTPTLWTSQWAVLGPAAGPPVPAALPPTDGVIWTVPTAIGYAYPSQGQILRAVAPNEAGAQNGPALGKTRRTHMYSALLQQSQGIKFGTDFSAMRPAQLRSKGGTPLALTTLYSAVHQDTLQDDYSFDSMLCWEIDRPYPATVCTLGAFLHTQDR